jgi:hypothetical protein
MHREEETLETTIRRVEVQVRNEYGKGETGCAGWALFGVRRCLRAVRKIGLTPRRYQM